MIKYYYINLDRRPDRNEHKQTQFKNAGITEYERFEALDGNFLKKYNVSLPEITLFQNADYKHKPNTKFIMGNQLSHIYIILKSSLNLVVSLA